MASFLFGPAGSEASGGTIGLDRSAKPVQGRPRSHSNTFFFWLRRLGAGGENLIRICYRCAISDP